MIKKCYPLFLAVTIILGVSGCGASKNEAPKMKNDKGSQVYVEDVTCGETITAGQELAVTVSGNLPSPAYSFEGFEVKVKKDVIEITPVANYDPGKMVAQVLVPFEEVCKVGNLKPGTYSLQVNSRTEPLIKKEHVKVKKADRD